MTKSERTALVVLKYSFDYYGVRHLTGIDKEVANYVSLVFKDTEKPSLEVLPEREVPEVVLDTLADLRIFGEEVYQKGLDIARNITVVQEGNSLLSYQTIVTYDSTDRSLVPGSGLITEIYVPERLDTYSHVLLGHEFIHAFNEVHLPEHLDSFVFGEILSIFYEFIKAPESLRDYFKKVNIAISHDESINYIKLKQDVKEHVKDRELRKIQVTWCGGYLVGIYYAIILYDMYLNDSKYVLEKVKRVLLGEITTLQMLNEMGIYGFKKQDSFDNGVKTLLKIR